MPAAPFALDFLGEVPNADQPSQFPEDKLALSGAFDPQSSWVSYNCWVEVLLDAGLVLHKPLPQYPSPVDSLGDVAIDDPRGDLPSRGVRVASNSRAVDFVQRGATSTYRFALRGQALRVAHQVPIPVLKKVGDQPAYPDERQFAYNVIVGNNSGIPVWYAVWDLHYFLKACPGVQAKAPVPFNPALKIRPDAKPPALIEFPQAPADARAVQQSTLRSGPLPGGGNRRAVT